MSQDYGLVVSGVSCFVDVMMFSGCSCILLSTQKKVRVNSCFVAILKKENLSLGYTSLFLILMYKLSFMLFSSFFLLLQISKSIVLL